MSQHEDIELQKYLHGDSALSRRYHSLDKPEPGATLDAAILAAAHAEARRPLRPGWMIPVALAATVVLGVGLSLQLQAPRPGPQYDTIGELDAQSRNAPTSEAMGAPARVGESEADDGVAKSPATVPELADMAQALATDEPEMAESPAARDVTLAEPRPRSDAVAVDDGRGAEATAEVARAAPKQQDVAPQRIVIAAEPAPAPASRVASAPQESLAAAGSAPAAEEEYAVAPEEASVQRYARTLRIPEDTDSLAVREPAAPPMSSFQASGDAAQVEGLRSSAALVRMEAADYLKIIERTYRDGNQDAARMLMIDFRKKFPDYVIPESFPLEDPAAIDDKTPASPSSE